MDRSEWDPRSLDNYDKKGNLKEVLMLSPTSYPKERFTKEGKSYYYTRRNKETGAIEPITSSNPLELLRFIPQVNQVWSHFDKKDSTKWTPKDLAFPLNVPYGGWREGNLSDWAFTSWLFNQAPTQLAPLYAKGRSQTQNIVMKGGRFQEGVKIPLTSKGMRDAALLSKSLNKGVKPSPGQVSTTPTSGDIKPGIVYNKQGLPVNPGFDTGYRSFVKRGRKAENLPVVRGEKSVEPITMKLKDKPYTLTTKRDYIAESGMDVEAGLNWLRVEQPAQLEKLLTTGRGKKQVLNTIDQLEKQYKTNKSVALKNKIDHYKSMVATGPAMDPSDLLLYGPNTKDFTGNTPALTAHLKGFVDTWEAQRHQSTHGHHYHMKDLQYTIYKRLFELKEQGIVTEGDILNTHAMLWASGMTSGGRRSGIMSIDGVPHIATHKLFTIKEGIEPGSQAWNLGELLPHNKRPKDVKPDIWNAVKEEGLEVNRFDLEYLEAWAQANWDMGKQGPRNIKRAIQKLKELKKDEKLYRLIGPDGKSEIARIREEIMNANTAAEIQEIQKSIAENITEPMTKAMQLSQDYAEHIGGGELMKYTKDLPGFHKEALKWNEEQLLFQERLKEKKERRLQNYEPGTPEYEYIEWMHDLELQHTRWRTGGGIQSFGRVR